MLTKNSGLVQMWVRFVQAGTFRQEQVPPLANLQALVAEVLAEEKTPEAV